MKQLEMYSCRKWIINYFLLGAKHYYLRPHLGSYRLTTFIHNFPWTHFILLADNCHPWIATFDMTLKTKSEGPHCPHSSWGCWRLPGGWDPRGWSSWRLGSGRLSSDLPAQLQLLFRTRSSQRWAYPRAVIQSLQQWRIQGHVVLWW